MHELTALINERQQRARELRAAARRADHPKPAESYAALAQRMEDERFPTAEA